MPKIKIRVTTDSNNTINNYEVKALLKDDKLIYYEKENKKTKVIFNYKDMELKRDNKEISMIYKFNIHKKTVGYIEIKDLKKLLKLNIETKKYFSDGKNIDMIFLVENEKICYKVEVLK